MLGEGATQTCTCTAMNSGLVVTTQEALLKDYLERIGGGSTIVELSIWTAACWMPTKKILLIHCMPLDNFFFLKCLALACFGDGRDFCLTLKQMRRLSAWSNLCLHEHLDLGVCSNCLLLLSIHEWRLSTNKFEDEFGLALSTYTLTICLCAGE